MSVAPPPTPVDAHEDRERRRDERVVGRDELSELGVGLAIDEEVHEPVRSGVDRITRAGAVADVHDRELPALVRRGDHRAHRLLAERGERHAIRVAVVVDELDVVRPFGDPRVHERLGGIGFGDGRNRHAVLGAVAFRDGDQRAGREQVGAIGGLACCLLRARSAGRGRVGEHVELGGDAEDEGGLAGVAERVRVGVDESREQGLATPVDRDRAGGCR